MLAVDSYDSPIIAPRKVVFPDGERAVGVDIGELMMCVVMVSGRVFCAGQNNYGQLGDGTSTNRGALVRMVLPTGFHAVNVSSGVDHTCALSSQGAVMCTGGNSNGQIGSANLRSDFGSVFTSTALSVVLPRPAYRIYMFRYHSFALLDNWKLYGCELIQK